MRAVFEHQVSLRWRDVDALGHVNHAVFLTYLEEGRDAFYVQALGRDPHYVVARVELDLRAEVRSTDRQLRVRIEVERVGTTSLTTRETIRTPAGVTAAEARVVTVLWDASARKPMAFAADEHARLATYRSAARVPTMRTLHVALRVGDLERSLAFYSAVGYTVVGTVEGTESGDLSMLQLPGDHFVTIELVHDPARGKAGPGAGISHLVIQVESLDATLADLALQGIAAGPPGLPGGADGPRTSWITDPDGHRIELVQWPAGHADGITGADFA